jgi:isoleucyl-tRNA synthetase
MADAPKQPNPIKESVLTPVTDFPMKASLTEREPESMRRWEEHANADGTKGLYAAIREQVTKWRAAGKPVEKFVLHDGPPYANGDAHTGTGMNKILKDFVVKFRTMQGFDSPYIPGWDCHGLPIEHKVLEELGGQKPANMSALEVRKMCHDFARGYIDTQRAQFKRTLTFGRWEKPYLTIDPVYEGGVLDCFADLMAKGYITRAKKPVHWSWAAQSALAEAELEYEDRKDPSIYVKFPVDAASASAVVKAAAGKRAMLVIWTTTPWTLPANVAVAVAPKAEYGLYHVGEEAWLLTSDLAAKVFEKAGLKDRAAVATFTGTELTALTYTHALWDTPGHRIVTAEYVTLEDGTGLVHTAPGHGAEDFETGRQYGLPNICPVDEKGLYYKGAAFIEQLGLTGKPLSERAKSWLTLLDGQHIFKANKLIIEKLSQPEASGQPLMVHWHEFTHSYPHCWRTHQPVIFRATEQWFVKIDQEGSGGHTLRENLLEQINKTQWFPGWGKSRISGMVGNRPDWCISRQRYWGIPIPAFVDSETGKVCCDATVAQRVADTVRQHGSDVWFDDGNWPVEKLLPDEFRPAEFKGRKLAKMADIFDVWFESGASHRGVVLAEKELREEGTPDTKFRPADLYLEGDDQHRGWFQVSLILSTATQGVSPFRQCLTSAFVVDEKGEKGSKSKGNIFAIDYGCNQVGADLLRLYFASVDTSSPIPVTLDLVRDKTSGPYRTLRNTIRILLGNLGGFDPAKHSVAAADMLEIDRWALSRLRKCVEEVTAATEKYEFHVATRILVDFSNLELSAFYVDVTKDRMYCDGKDSVRRRSGQTAMHAIASAVIRMLAPICPHTADEAWAHLPGAVDAHWSVHLAAYPKAGDFVHEEALESRYAAILKLREASESILDRMRKDKTLKNSREALVTVRVAADADIDIRALFACGNDHDACCALATCLGVSHLVVADTAATGEEPAHGIAGLFISAKQSPFAKCERCWNHWDSTKPRANRGGAALCDRCERVMGEL